MSEEQKEPIPENTNNSSEKASPEEERKKQFERMKEKFKKQNSPFGGNKNSNNNGNNFYWIYAAVIGVLLFIVFYGNYFNSHLIEVSQGEFYQNRERNEHERSGIPAHSFRDELHGVIQKLRGNRRHGFHEVDYSS